MSKLIVGNWKMNPASLKEAVQLAKACDKKGAAVAPPFVFLSAVSGVLKHAALGAQDVFYESAGAYTGEISVDQLKSLGVKYVIVGHSERRALGESDVVISKKIKAALASGLRVILCVGEKWNTRKKGIAAVKKFVAGQLRKDLEGFKNSRIKNLVIAYEPVWAVGTGKNDNPESASKTAGFIKELLVKGYKFKVRVLYGGSVNARNAESFLNKPEIGGFLIGGASLKAGEFKKIVNIKYQ